MMQREETEPKPKALGELTDANMPALTPEQLDSLSDAEKQAQYKKAYLEQLKQRACPGCGEADELF